VFGGLLCRFSRRQAPPVPRTNVEGQRVGCKHWGLGRVIAAPESERRLSPAVRARMCLFRKASRQQAEDGDN
jgi:hypothetical protein